MPNKFYSVILNLSDGHSALALNYAVSVCHANNLTGEQLETAILEVIAADQEFTFNGEYYETVGDCGVQLNRIEEITEAHFEAIKHVFPNAISHLSYEVDCV